MHNGPGNGRKPLIIGGAIIGAIWLLNSTYRDGFMDGLLASGKGGVVHYAGGGFPWGLLIIGGILFFFWKRGSFDRHNGRPFGPGGSPYPPATMQAQGPDPRAFMNPEQRAQWEQQQAQWAQRQDQGQPFRGPRGIFDDWHRQAHDTFAQHGGSTGPVAPPPYSGPAGGPPTPPPPPAADYWANVNRPAESAAEPQGPAGSAGGTGATGSAGTTAGSQPEQW